MRRGKLAYDGAVRRILWALDGDSYRGEEFFDGLAVSDKAKALRVIAALGDQPFVITHGFEKKQDKVPVREIERACRIRTSYLEDGR